MRQYLCHPRKERRTSQLGATRRGKNMETAKTLASSLSKSSHPRRMMAQMRQSAGMTMSRRYTTDRGKVRQGIKLRDLHRTRMSTAANTKLIPGRTQRAPTPQMQPLQPSLEAMLAVSELPVLHHHALPASRASRRASRVKLRNDRTRPRPSEAGVRPRRPRPQQLIWA